MLSGIVFWPLGRESYCLSGITSRGKWVRAMKSPDALVTVATTRRRRRCRGVVLAAAMATSLFTVGASAAASASRPGESGQPDFGPNVLVFDTSMPTSQIQAAVDAVTTQQLDDEMGTNRYALLFKPGIYGTDAEPLIIQVGYYTEVAGLGASPTDVTINGHIDVYNRCLAPGNCVALNNFWRSLSNLTIKVNGLGLDGCRASGNFWAVSQAAPMRRVNVTGGNLTLMDYCSGPSFASGGFIADSRTDFVINGSQQQFLVRDSSVGGWSNGVWNQVFSGVSGAPAQCFPANASCGGPYTTLATTPVSREKPYLFVDAKGRYRVLVPAPRSSSSGTTWENGQTPGRSIPLSDFFVAKPSDSVKTINNQLARGKNLILTPGVYDIDRTISIKRADTVVLGMGIATLTSVNGATVMSVADVEGVDVAGVMIDAGPVNAPVLMQVGEPRIDNGKSREHNHWSDPEDPTALHDVFFRIGGPHVGKATVSLEVDSDNVILDNLWAWRADHGNPGSVGWTVNTADTGVVVNGDDVIATGLFVEHYQKTEVIWNGDGGRVVFFQNELPYDPPSQAAWNQPSGVLGYSAMKVTDGVSSFNGWGMGSYSFFNQGIDIFAANAFEVPTTLPAGSLNDLLTIFLDPSAGKGGILNVINGIGGSSTIANPDVPVPVVSYP